MLYSFGKFLPDMPDHMNSGVTVARNVMPRATKSYGPMPSFAAYATALNAKCQGAFFVIDKNGVVNGFTGTASRLYRNTVLSPTPENVSAGGGSPYTTSAADRWSFAQFGDKVIATNYTDAPQVWQLAVDSAFAALGGSPPKARYIAVIKDFVALANINDVTDGKKPARIHWSAIDNPAYWPTVGSSSAAAVLSDIQDLAGEGGDITGIVGGIANADGVIFQERALWRMLFVGGGSTSDPIFTFDQVEGESGTSAMSSVIRVGSVVYYYGENGFRRFDGATATPIGHGQVDMYVSSNLELVHLNRIVAAHDAVNTMVWWAMPFSGNTDGMPNYLIGYNYLCDCWCEVVVDNEWLASGLSFGDTLDSLDNINISLDALPYSLDSRAHSGSRQNLVGFNSLHQLGFFDGANMEATLETGELAADNGQRFMIQGLRPIVDGGTITALTRYRNTPQAALSDTTATSAALDGICPQRISARYVRARVSVAAGGAWTHAKGVEPVMEMDGER